VAFAHVRGRAAGITSLSLRLAGTSCPRTGSIPRPRRLPLAPRRFYSCARRDSSTCRANEGQKPADPRGMPLRGRTSRKEPTKRDTRLSCARGLGLFPSPLLFFFLTSSLSGASLPYSFDLGSTRRPRDLDTEGRSSRARVRARARVRFLFSAILRNRTRCSDSSARNVRPPIDPRNLSPTGRDAPGARDACKVHLKREGSSAPYGDKAGAR
jgi:hypothetical protein